MPKKRPLRKPYRRVRQKEVPLAEYLECKFAGILSRGKWNKADVLDVLDYAQRLPDDFDG